jgi:hypothetical protein
VCLSGVKDNLSAEPGRRHGRQFQTEALPNAGRCMERAYMPPAEPPLEHDYGAHPIPQLRWQGARPEPPGFTPSRPSVPRSVRLRPRTAITAAPRAGAGRW